MRRDKYSWLQGSGQRSQTLLAPSVFPFDVINYYCEVHEHKLESGWNLVWEEKPLLVKMN